jgi:Histidine phosphatase superfamily (branch 1)
LKNALPIVYLARHGETARSLSGQHTGLTDLPLTEHGEHTARQLGKRLKGLTFAKLFTSPEQRARQTSELSWFGAVAEIDPDLEWNYGKYEGHRGDEIRAERPDWSLFRDGCPEGETPSKSAPVRTVSLAECVRFRETTRFHKWTFHAGMASRWLGLEPTPNGRYFMLSTAILSGLGYENDLFRTVSRFWSDTRHVDIERGVAAHASP